MRCKECNVDLAETYTTCPLCSAKAVDEPPRLEGFTVAPYNKDVYAEPNKKKEKYSTGFSLEKLKAYFHL